MQHNRKRDALTILLVPHSERAPVSLRLPVWLVPLLTAALVTLMAAAIVFAVQYQQMRRRLNGLLSDQTTEEVRQREMRATILSQQDEVRDLSTQVEGFRAELLSVRRLSDEIRDILGLPAPMPVTPAPTPTSQSLIPGQGRGGPELAAVPTSGRLALQPSTRSMRAAVESGHEVVGMRSTMPAEVQALQELRQLVVERMSRIDQDDRGDWESLQRDLRQWAAAPHLWPVHPHPITSEFGYRELRGTYGMHYGIDMAAWTGAKVQATKDGTVTYSGWKDGFGLVVEIDHEAGYSTLYAHNSSLIVRAGDRVKAGDTVALSGSTGNSTGPHVHYEIHLYNTPVDPLRYIDEG